LKWGITMTSDNDDRHDGRLRGTAHVADEQRLDLTEGGLVAAREELGNRAVRTLDLVVDVPERATEALGDLRAYRRLPRAHVPDEDDVPV